MKSFTKYIARTTRNTSIIIVYKLQIYNMIFIYEYGKMFGSMYEKKNIQKISFALMSV